MFWGVAWGLAAIPVEAQPQETGMWVISAGFMLTGMIFEYIKENKND